MQDEQRNMLSIHIKTFLKKYKKIDFTEFYKRVINFFIYIKHLNLIDFKYPITKFIKNKFSEGAY